MERPEIFHEDQRAVFVGDELVCLQCMTDEDWEKVWFGCVVSLDFLNGMDDSQCDRCGKNLEKCNLEFMLTKSSNLSNQLSNQISADSGLALHIM